MARLLLSLILGAVITFFLFVLMAFLVNQEGSITNAAKEQIVIEINTTPPESQAQTRQRVPPPPPPPPPEPPKQQMVQEASNLDAGTIGFNAPSIDVGGVSGGIGDPAGALMRDGDEMPIARFPPKYPVQAARDGINGWVKMRFSIMPDGSVDEVEVVDAQPKRIFDREAIRALKRWKYKPKIENGVALKRTGVQVVLDFNLDDAGG